MSDFRSRLAEDTEARYAKLLELLDAAIDSEKTYPVVCPRACCRGAKFNATFPDYRVMLDAARFMVEQGFGKPKEAPKTDTPSLVLTDLSNATDTELARISGQASRSVGSSARTREQEDELPPAA